MSATPEAPEMDDLPPIAADFRTPEMEQAEKGANVPDASELALEDINPFNAHLFREDRYASHFARLRAEDPVHFNELEVAGRYWSITRYDDIKSISSQPEIFSSASGISLGFKAGTEQQGGFPQSQSPFISQDGKQHDEQRATVQPSVAPRNLAKLEPMIRERTQQLLDELPEGATFDWVDTVSIELTTLMLATLFDFPLEDRRKLTRWSDIVFAIPGPGGVVETQEQKRTELMECVQYFTGLWDERRGREGNDLVTMLANGESTKHLSPAEQLGNLLLLIVGGNDTTRNTMSGSVYAFDKYPDEFAKLQADPGMVKKMVPEIVRWQTPLSYMRRTALEDVEFGGKQIKKDDQVLLWYISGNRDEDVFEKGEVLDLDRPNAARHLSFGWGPHFCMGSRLAEMQLRVLWEEALPRFERVEVQEEPERIFSSFVHGYATLPVQVRRK